MRHFALFIALALGCSSGPEPEAPTTDDPWVKEYVAAADTGCECKDADCLEASKTKLTAMEDKHGGLDEAPFEVHTARGHFMTCYRKGTVDPVRDMTSLVNQLCACANKACLDKTLIDHLHFRDKYADKPPPSAAAIAELAKLDERFEACRNEKIISGDRLATAFEEVATAACTCKGEDRDPCREKAAKMLPEKTGPFVMVKSSTASEARVETALNQICRCTLTEEASQILGNVAVSGRCPPKPK